MRFSRGKIEEAEVGFEPTNNGFAIRPLSPLGYSAVNFTIASPLGAGVFQSPSTPSFAGDSDGL